MAALQTLVSFIISLRASHSGGPKRYSDVTLFSGYPLLTVARIDHNMDIQYQIKHDYVLMLLSKQVRHLTSANTRGRTYKQTILSEPKFSGCNHVDNQFFFLTLLFC